MDKPNLSLVGSAGVHHVVSELSRRGLIALLTTRNVAGVDVVVTTTDGKKHANIQVKTSLKRVSFFLMPRSEQVNAGTRTWYVLLRWLDSEHRFEGFMLSGRQARQEVERGEHFQEERIAAGTRKRVNPSIYVSRKVERRARHWRKRWQQWKL